MKPSPADLTHTATATLHPHRGAAPALDPHQEHKHTCTPTPPCIGFSTVILAYLPPTAQLPKDPDSVVRGLGVSVNHNANLLYT